MNDEQQLDYYNKAVVSEGHLIDFLHFLSDARELAIDDSYYFDHWLDFVECVNAENEAVFAVKH